jgi:hypothetical protein
MRSTIFRRWIQAWSGAALIGIANGIAREKTYGRGLAEQTAHQVSVATAITAFAVYFRFLNERWPVEDDEQAWAIGGCWLGMTVAFEFGFGRAVAKESWEDLLADYNVARGRLWPLVLAWIGVGPVVTRKLRNV